MLKKRIITAVIAIPIALILILYVPSTYFAALAGLLILGGAWEWSNFVGLEKNTARIIYVACVLIGLLLAAFLPIAWVLMIAWLVWCCIAVAIYRYQNNTATTGLQCVHARALSGFIILIATWVSIVTLQTQMQWQSPYSLIYLLCIVWAADVGAYFSGKYYGQSPLATRVSPKKTWAGFWGGLIAAMLIAAIGGIFLTHHFLSYIALMFLSLITILFSVIGDLGVSLFKRIRDVKDSGNFFPGHGGILDRIDSIAAASVVFVLGITFIPL